MTTPPPDRGRRFRMGPGSRGTDSPGRRGCSRRGEAVSGSQGVGIFPGTLGCGNPVPVLARSLRRPIFAAGAVGGRFRGHFTNRHPDVRGPVAPRGRRLYADRARWWAFAHKARGRSGLRIPPASRIAKICPEIALVCAGSSALDANDPAWLILVSDRQGWFAPGAQCKFLRPRCGGFAVLDPSRFADRHRGSRAMVRGFSTGDFR